MMLCLYLALVNMGTTVLGCTLSTEEVDAATPAQLASYATHVLLGEVASLLPVDPLALRVIDTAYGAIVRVRCSYKGGPLPGTITIGEAGFIPGLCGANELVADRKYVLFLSDARVTVNGTFYVQFKTAEPVGNITRYLDVCGLEIVYPQENGVPLERDLCPNVKRAGDCQQFDTKKGETETVSIQPSSSTLV